MCSWASAAGCQRIVFTSSIAPYGPSGELKNEESLPVPDSPYGSSKLAAEKVHMVWQAACNRRKLLILRPGVVFGPGERGNVTRLIRSVVKGYFVYMGNRQTRKAGGYVKELCRVMQFGLSHQDESGESFTLLNFSIDPPPTLETYVTAIQNAAGIRRTPLNLPRPLLLADFLPDSRRRIAVRNPATHQPGAGAEVVPLHLDRSQRTEATRVCMEIHSRRGSFGLAARHS